MITQKIESGIKISWKICYNICMDKLIKFGFFKELPQSPGVYEIINTQTGDKYIGSTNNIRKRLTAHEGQLRNLKHCNAYLQNSYLKYGHTSFGVTHRITDSKKEAIDLEQQLINSGNYKYNLSSLATPGYIPTDSICEYSLEGVLVEIYPSIKIAAEKLNISPIDIAYCCIGLIQDIRLENKIFRFTNSSSEKSIDLKNKYTPEDIDWAKFWYSKNYIIYKWDYNGNILNEFDNIKNLCEGLGVTTRMFQRHLIKKYLTVKGGIYSLTKVFPGAPSNIRNWPVLRLDEKGNILERYEYPYVEKLREQGYAYSVIIDALKLRKGTNKAKNMFWKYDDGKPFIAIKTTGTKQKIKVTILDDGCEEDMEIFNSIKDASLFLNTHRSYLYQCIQKNRLYKGKYKLEYIND